MKVKIHPKYVDCTVTCGCGNSFETRSTSSKITVEICSACHPFYTGKQKFVDAAGRVEKFQKRHAWSEEQKDKLLEKKRSKRATKEKISLDGPKRKKRKADEAGSSGAGSTGAGSTGAGSSGDRKPGTAAKGADAKRSGS